MAIGRSRLRWNRLQEMVSSNSNSPPCCHGLDSSLSCIRIETCCRRAQIGFDSVLIQSIRACFFSIRFDELLLTLLASFDEQPDNPPPLPLDDSIALDSHFPPSHVSLGSMNGRRIAFTLGGEGRRLEMLDLGDTSTAQGSSAVGGGEDVEMK